MELYTCAQAIRQDWYPHYNPFGAGGLRKALSISDVDSFLTQEKQYAEVITESYYFVVETINS